MFNQYLMLNKVSLSILFRLSALAISALAMASFAGTSPKANFYTLNSQISNETIDENLNKNTSNLTIHIASVVMDETVDKPQLVIRTTRNQVEILEQQRWAQPLKNEILRVVAEHLSVLLGTNKITTYPLAANKSDYIVTIQVQNFESKPSENVQMRAYWTVRRTLDNFQTSNTLEAMQAISNASPSNYDALIMAHNQNLSRLSADIAKSIAVISIN